MNDSTPTHAAATAGFSSFVIVMNPASTNAAQGKQRIAELRKRYGRECVTVIRLTAGTRGMPLLAPYSRLLGPETLLGIAAGDGTVNTIINELVQGEGLSATARQTVILPLWGGNANDMAHMLNGAASNKPLDTLLSQAHIAAIRPLVCTIADADGTTHTYVAAAYASFGASAFTAQRLNSADHRGRPLYRLPLGRRAAEIQTGVKALADTPTFRIIEQGKRKTLYERTFANGPRFARISHFPVNLAEPFFYQHSVRRKRLASIIRRLARFVHMPPSAGRKTTEASFVLEQPTAAQFDGETIELQAGAHISIRLAEQPFYALATKVG